MGEVAPQIKCRPGRNHLQQPGDHQLTQMEGKPVATLALATNRLGSGHSKKTKQCGLYQPITTPFHPLILLTLLVIVKVHAHTHTKLILVLRSTQQLRLFRRAAPYPSREERTDELKDALDRYQLYIRTQDSIQRKSSHITCHMRPTHGGPYAGQTAPSIDNVLPPHQGSEWVFI